MKRINWGCICLAILAIPPALWALSWMVAAAREARQFRAERERFEKLHPEATAKPQSPPPLVQASEEQQAKRREKLSYFVTAGLLDSIDNREIRVDAKIWNEMQFADKQRLAESLCAYQYRLDALPADLRGAEYWLRFNDSRTNKVVGRYAPVDGLHVY